MTAGTKTWIVRPSRFPFGISDEVLGTVSGATRDDALRKATDLYGRAVIVELATFRPPKGPEQKCMPPRGLQPPATRRPMTADEAQMARAVAVCPMLARSRQKAAMRNLHARIYTADRSITDAEAASLCACVLAFSSQLAPHIVRMAEHPNSQKAGVA